MSRKIENTVLQRYCNDVVVDHLASNYVLGLLHPRVRNRLEKLCNQFEYQHIMRRISYWESTLSPLDMETPELAPLPETWENIQRTLKLGNRATVESQRAQDQGFWQRFSWWKFSTAFSLVLCAILTFSLISQPESLGEMSYVAVLEDSNDSPQVVAATYGDAKKLVLDIISLPEIDEEQSFELWVTSKTDNQTRSLGEIPKGKKTFDRELTVAEWRLIKDSSFLAISVEDEGGSAIGEPSDFIVSRGPCVRLDNDAEQS